MNRGCAALRTPWRDSVIYELHVRGMTMLRGDIPHRFRGTLAGLASPPIIAHLRRLGVTAIELLPTHPVVDEPSWSAWACAIIGDTTRSIFSLWSALRDGNPIAEFREAVASFHESGIEVILDVVFNHTGKATSWVDILLSWHRQCLYTICVREPARLCELRGTATR